MRKLSLAALMLIAFQTWAFACDACERQQPAITKGLTHGRGPQSSWDWVIVALVTILTLVTLVYSVKFLWKTKEERKQDHIKNTILHY